MKVSFSFEELSCAVNNLPGALTITRAEGLQNAVRISGVPRVLTVETFQTLNTTVVEQMAMREENAERLIFTPYVNPTCAQRLRKHGLMFVDQAGNAFLNSRGFYLFVSKDLPKKERPGQPVNGPKRTFRESTLKLVYAFLTDTERGHSALLNQPYRRMSEVSGVAVGSIGAVVGDLAAEGFVEELEPGVRRLENRAELLARWVQEYGQRLRPKLRVTTYRSPVPDWAEKVQTQACPGLWGGEVAGAKLTGYLVPETATIYTADLGHEFVVKNDLRKDPSGNVEVLRPFWPVSEQQGFNDCAHPLVVYADLMATEIGRNLETARRIYEKHLQALVTSD